MVQDISSYEETYPFADESYFEAVIQILGALGLELLTRITLDTSRFQSTVEEIEVRETRLVFRDQRSAMIVCLVCREIQADLDVLLAKDGNAFEDLVLAPKWEFITWLPVDYAGTINGEEFERLFRGNLDAIDDDRFFMISAQKPDLASGSAVVGFHLTLVPYDRVLLVKEIRSLVRLLVEPMRFFTLSQFEVADLEGFLPRQWDESARSYFWDVFPFHLLKDVVTTAVRCGDNLHTFS